MTRYLTVLMCNFTILCAHPQLLGLNNCLTPEMVELHQSLWSRNIVDWLKLPSTIGYPISSLQAEFACETEGLEFDSCMQGRRCALLLSSHTTMKQPYSASRFSRVFQIRLAYKKVVTTINDINSYFYFTDAKFSLSNDFHMCVQYLCLLPYCCLVFHLITKHRFMFLTFSENQCTTYLLKLK